MKKLFPSKKAFKFSIILNIILSTAILHTPSVNAQIPSGGAYSMNAPNEWTFIKGDTAQGIAVYGTMGVPDPANKPGGGGYSGTRDPGPILQVGRIQAKTCGSLAVHKLHCRKMISGNTILPQVSGHG